MNNDIGSRIDELITSLKIKKVRFAERLGIDQSYVTQLTSGRRNPSDLLIGAICREFNVNEKWLRTGEGGAEAMFLAKTREEEIAAAVERLITGESSEFKKRLVLALSSLKDEHWLLLEQKLKEIIGERSSEEQLKAEVEKEVELYRENRLSEKEPDTPVSSVKESGAV